MNKISDVEKLNQTLLIHNHRLTIQVQVLNQQIVLLERRINNYEKIQIKFTLQEEENIKLKKDNIQLQEYMETLITEKLNIQEKNMLQQIQELNKQHEQNICDLKQIYESKLKSLEQEKIQISEQAHQIGLQNQKSKSLERQAEKIIQMSNRIEKVLSDNHFHTPSHGHIGISKEMYDQMVGQLKSTSINQTTEQDVRDSHIFSQRYKKTSIASKQDKAYNVKKLTIFTRVVDSPRASNQQNTNGVKFKQ